MQYIPRIQEARIAKALARGKSVLLLGPRQTGKTTLLKRLKNDLEISFVAPETRLRYEKEPHTLAREAEALARQTAPRKPLILIDEVQKIPSVLDTCQDLIDRGIARFVLTGSSARKLRQSHANLLPGRVVALRMDPLTFKERPQAPLNEQLLFGSLPGILQSKNLSDRETDLESYVTTYLEEEVRLEAIVRNVGSFARFLEYAASESGGLVNFRKLSQEIGVSHTTIASYYEILEDCLIAERIEPLTKSKTRKKLTRSQKYLFFDLGVRRLAASEGTPMSREALGRLFEQYVGLELVRCSRLTDRKIRVRFWRDPSGPEIDWVIEEEGRYVPLEVKWTANPRLEDLRHLKIFLSEYPNAKTGYVVCQTPRRLLLDKNIFAIPWAEIDKFVF